MSNEKLEPDTESLLMWQQNTDINPAGRYWSPGRPEDVPLQRPQDVP